NLMIRLWAGWFTATLQAARTGRGDRPLLVVLDCKGGRDARVKADRQRRLLRRHLQAALTLAIDPPCGPPLSTAGFLDWLEARWLQHAWSDGRHPGQLNRVQSAARHLPDIQLRYATLLGRLGPALDGPGTLQDADAWYFIL